MEMYLRRKFCQVKGVGDVFTLCAKVFSHQKAGKQNQ